MDENIPQKQPENTDGTKVEKRPIEEEMKKSYVDYAMSVIVGRALPDVRDGLKPVHRRVLYAMHKAGLYHNKPFRKSAFIVGRVMSEFHPHGDSAIYDTLVRMAQDFSLRYPLVQGQGNFGCFTENTKIKLTDGRDLSFKELIKEHKEGKKNFTYTVNSEGLIEIAEIINPRLTKRNQKIMKVTLDNGEEIKCTLNHRFMLTNEKYEEIQNLDNKTSLMPLHLRLSNKKDNIKPELEGYQMVYQRKNNDWICCHLLADEWNLKKGVYKKSEGRIRHHLDFNKLNNNPDNIKRIQWKDHWKLHSEHASKLHKDNEYKEKIAQGRKKFWSDKKNKEIYAKRLSKRNIQNWKNSKYRNHMKKTLSVVNKEYVKKNPQVKKKASNRLKEKWKDPQYRKMMSQLKSKEMKRRWENNDPTLNRFSSEKSKEIWSNPEHRIKISNVMKNLWKDSKFSKKRSEESKKLWKKEEYRAKFPENHFSDMAKKMWKNAEIQEMHRKKAISQWQDSDFKKKFVNGVKAKNKQRLKENPKYMKQIAQKAKIVLKNKWRDSSYKEKVIKSKILSFVNSLTIKYSQINSNIYENERTNNGIPKIKNALKYFNNFEDLVQQAKKYNHKIIKTEILTQREDVYDLTINGTHNFALAAGVFVHNSVDGDSAAAYRYTEARLNRLSEEMLEDIEKETVEFQPNFDNNSKEPIVLPSKAPNLLLNGSSGIAVGMATNIPPHNVGEVIDGTIKQIDNPDISVEELMEIITGPDFPTGGIICGRNGIINAYSTGRGKVVIRAKTKVEEVKGKKCIIVTEIPYMVNKAELISYIAGLVRNKKIDGIADLRDESDREGMRFIIELKRDVNDEVVLNQLYSHSRLQTTFGINMLALVDNEPRVLNLKDLISYFIKHREEVVRRRTTFELNKAKKRAHILEGLIIALDNIDKTIKLIKESKSVSLAREILISTFSLSEEQANAILEMRLQKLTSLEQENIKKEHKELLHLIEKLEGILKDQKKILDIIKDELIEIKLKYNDERRSEIIDLEFTELNMEDLIEEEDMVVTITHSGYIKRLPINTYKQQKRGGKGVIGTITREEDFVKDLFVANTHANLLFFTNKGRVHWLKVYNIPEGSRQAKGKAIVNLLELDQGEKVTACIPVYKFDNERFLIMATRKGTVKKTKLMAFGKPRKGGIIAISLYGDDELIEVRKTDGNQQIIIATKFGSAVRFHEKNVRASGRSAQGVRGIKLRGNDIVIGMVVADENKTLLTVTENGYGKRTKVSDYRLISRGGSGVRNIIFSKRNGSVVSINSVIDNDDIMFISKKGIIIRVPVSGISIIGRNTQGFRLMRLIKEDRVVAATKIITE